MKNMVNKKINTILSCLILFVLNACIEHKPAPLVQDKIIEIQHKKVSVYNFKKIEAHSFNFNIALPTMLHSSDGILYMSNKDPKSLYAWDVENGNDKAAWIRLQDFRGKDVHASYDLNTAKRKIKRLGAAPNGVLVALSSSVARGTSLLAGVARFYGQDPKALWSRTFIADEAHQNWPIKIYDLAEMKNKDGTMLSFALIEVAPPRFAPRRYFVWANNLMASSSFIGAGAEASALTTIDSSPLPENSPISAFSVLPDENLILAHRQGLRSIASESLRVARPLKLMVQQKEPKEVLDKMHRKQWQKGFSDDAKVKEIIAMAVVAHRYLLVLASDGGGQQSLSYADTSVQPLNFESAGTLLRGAKKIVVNGPEAKIISPSAIYSFKNGKLKRELSNKFSRNKAVLEKMGIELRPEEFVGGSSGNIPPDGTKFYDAAPHLGDWFYATNKGLYRVRKSKEVKMFNKKK